MFAAQFSLRCSLSCIRVVMDAFLYVVGAGVLCYPIRHRWRRFVMLPLTMYLSYSPMN
jgi:hypothetical protein